MPSLPRRHFLRAATAYASLLTTERAHAVTPRALVADPKRILDLPPGFSYRIVSRRGERMRDGYSVPANPDAMGVFAARGKVVLMRNHEVAPGDVASGAFPSGAKLPPEAYDPAAYGGVTRLVLDAETLKLEYQELALCGTHWNCAGGSSPWGWLSCEEIFVPEHGYVFLAPHDAQGLTKAQPIKGYGRFRHEAATVDPRTSIAYLTEDREDAAFYRFVPEQAATPFTGRLQALRIKGQPGCNTSHLPLQQPFAIDWVDVPEPDPREDDVRLQARERGAAYFARTEGMWLAGDALYMCATLGGPVARGQIFRLDYAAAEPSLRVVAQSADPAVLDMPDNITVAPSGDLFVAEDGLEGNWLRRITPDGAILPFARNAASDSELAGPCFAPDGRTLFVNLQRDGLTLAIHGPFDAGVPELAANSGKPEPAAPGGGLIGVGAGLGVLGLAALMQRRRRVRAERSP